MSAGEIKKITGKAAKQLQEDLTRLSELADAAQEHKKLDERVKKSMKEGKSIRDVLLEENLLPEEEILRLLK